MGESAPQPYPYQRWPRLRAEPLARLRRIVRGLLAGSARGAIAEAEALLGCELRASAGAAEWLEPAAADALLDASPLVLWLARADGARDLPVLCALAPDLGARLVDRVLGGEGRAAHAPGAPLDPLSAGVLAYLAARVLAAAGAELRVVDVVQARQRAAALLAGGAVLALPFTVELGSAPAEPLRLLAGERAADALALAAPRGAAPPLPDALRRLPLALCAHAAQLTLTRDQLRALAPGDVVVPERCALARDALGFSGAVTLHVVGGRRARFMCAARGAQLVIETVEHDDARSPMSDATRIPTKALPLAPETDLLQLAGDAPIELCLELARFRLPLEELSALRPGEVLSTGTKIGERAALSAGGKTVARGELVEVDGAIGLRILELVR